MSRRGQNVFTRMSRSNIGEAANNRWILKLVRQQEQLLNLLAEAAKEKKFFKLTNDFRERPFYNEEDLLY